MKQEAEQESNFISESDFEELEEQKDLQEVKRIDSEGENHKWITLEEFK